MASKGNIIAVEDDAGVRSLLKMALTMEGYTVTEAENGMKGYELLKEKMISTSCSSTLCFRE